MQHNVIPGLSRKVARIALGTVEFGTGITRDTAFALLDAYAEAGGNFLDTAHLYAAWRPGGAGVSERTIGAWLNSRGMRSGMVLASKGGHHDLATGQSRLNPRALDCDLSESLERLGTGTIDLYWLHRDDPTGPVEELLGWAAEQIRRRRIGALGCSNWTVARQQAVSAAARRNPDWPDFCASQIGWSLAENRLSPTENVGMLFMDEPTHAFHCHAARPVVAFSSQGNGFFGSQKLADPAVNHRYGTAKNRTRRQAANLLASGKGVTANQVALAWLWHQPIQVVPIIGPRTLAQLRDSLGAASLSFSPAEVDWLAEPGNTAPPR